MKKCIVVLVVLVATMSTNAQSLFPEKGDFGLEICFKPFVENGGFNLLDNGVKIRYYFKDNNALRLRVGLNLTKVHGKVVTSYNSAYSNIDLGLGYEHHWYMSDRIGLYTGVQVGYAKSFTSHDGYDTSDNNENASSYQLAAGALTGIDVYIWKGLYCGAEMGLMLTHTKEREKEVNYVSHPEHTYTIAGFYCEPAIRLGWTF